MLKITRYRCEYCGREYDNAASCKRCEEMHNEKLLNVRLMLRLDTLTFSFSVDEEHSADPAIVVHRMYYDNAAQVYCLSWGAKCNGATLSSTKKSLLVQASMTLANISGAMMEATKEVNDDKAADN